MSDEKNLFYELRIYSVIPEHLPELMDLWESRGRSLIAKHMRCCGVWLTESGELNQIYHIYKWSSLDDREAARKRFYEDLDCQSYVRSVKRLYRKQSSVMLRSLPNLF